MPKKKSESSDNPAIDSSIKKKSTEERSKHGRKEKSFQHILKTKEKKELSSNWKELSKSLGVTLQRKTSAGSRSVKRRPGNDGSASVKTPDIWFDDVPMEVINGEYTTKLPKNEIASASLITGQNKSVGRHVALDCEMVGTGSEGSYSMLARACVVNHHGNVLYDSFVAPMDRITDYRTSVSGVLPKHLRGAPDFSVVQKKISDLLKDRILVGHSVQNDLKALLLSHPKKDIRDTSKYRVFKTIAKTRYPSLKKLAKEILGIDIQSKEHNPVEDAQVAMKLYHLHRKDWEASVRARLTRSEIRQRRREKRKRRQDAERSTSSYSHKPVLEKPFNVVLHTS